MPSWPTGVTTVSLVYGKGITIGGNMTSATLTVDPVYNGTNSVIWVDDGTPMLSFSEQSSANEGAYGSIAVPVVDQDGWVDNGLHPFKMWGYKLTETPMYGRTKGAPRVKYWQPLTGQTTVDFDLIPDGSLGLPSSGPLAVVTSVNGQTGAVTLSGSGGPISDATTTSKGVIQLAGALGGTAAAPTVPGLALKADSASLAAVATTGSYSDLSNTPTIPTTSAGISDFAEAAQDAAASMFRAGTNVTFTYDDAANTFTINASGGGAGGTDPEVVRDVIGGALVGGANIQITVNDAADSITITATGVLQAGNNLSDVQSIVTARNNLDVPANADIEQVYRPAKYGAIGDGTTDDTAALNACFAAAAAAGGRVVLAAVTYRTTAALTYSATNVRLEGAGAGKTVIKPDAATYNTLSLGDGTGGQVRPTGYARGFSILGPSMAPTTGKAAFLVNGLNQFEVDRVQVDNHDIGFDLINNCYGSNFRTIRGGFGGSLNVGINLREGDQSGSDLTFYNAWVNGRIAGVHVAGNGGGYHFYSGQITAGQGTSAPNDNAGAFVVGKDYLTGTTGATNVDIHATSIEGTNYAWAIRAFWETFVDTYSMSFTPQDGTRPAIGVYKITNAANSKFNLASASVGGTWSSANLVSVSGDYDDFLISEVDTHSAQPFVNGSEIYVWSIARQSQIIKANITDSIGTWVKGLGLRNAAGVLQQTTDNGVSWAPVTGAAPPDATTTSKGLVQLAGDLAGTAAAPTVPGLAIKSNVRVNGTHVDQFDVDTTPVTATDVGARPVLTTNAVSTGTTGTLAGQTINPIDATAGAITRTLPTPAFVGQEIVVEKVDSSTNTVTVTGTIRGATASVTIAWQYESAAFIAESLSSWRVPYGHKTKTALDAAYRPVTTKGDILVAPSSNLLSRLPIGTDGYVLTADSTQTLGVGWAAGGTGGGSGGGIPPSTVTTKGDLIAATGNAAVTRLPAGQDGYILAADSTATTGLRYIAPPSGGGSTSTYVSPASLRGYRAWSGDPGAFGSASAMVSGTFYAVKMAADAGTLAKIATAIDTAATNLTYFALGVYDSSGNQLAAIASNTGLATTTGYKSSALNATPTLSAGQIIYLGVLAIGTGTLPSIRRMGNSTNVASPLLYEGTSPYTALASQSALPSSFTPGANPNTTFVPWMAVA